MARGRNGGKRSKPKKKPNRYNPNRPNWNEVHAPWVFNLFPSGRVPVSVTPSGAFLVKG